MQSCFVAITPPDEISSQLKHYQKLMANRFNSVETLDQIPHITLVPPFHLQKEKFDSLYNVLSEVCDRKEFSVALNGFSHFRKHTIYVTVLNNRELESVHLDLLENLNETEDLLPRKMSYFQRFVPHLTVGYKDLKPNFTEAWKYFQSLVFSENFTCSGIDLLVHNGVEWHIERHFEFRK